MPFRRILCALDFEPGSARALVVAAALVQHDGGTLHLLHAASPLFTPGQEDRAASFQTRVRAFVDRVLGPDAFHALSPLVHDARDNDVADAILQGARHAGVDVIVVGTHGRRGVGHLILGSVAAQVVRRAQVPVWVVPEQAALPGPEHPVVVAIDLTEASVPLLRAGGAVAESFGASVVPVHVHEVPETVEASGPPADVASREPIPMTRQAARTAVSDALRAAEVNIGRADLYVVRGAPGRGIVYVAERSRAGLVVMAPHGHAERGRFRLGGVTEWVLRHAVCPVLTVPEE